MLYNWLNYAVIVFHRVNNCVIVFNALNANILSMLYKNKYSQRALTYGRLVVNPCSNSILGLSAQSRAVRTPLDGLKVSQHQLYTNNIGFCLSLMFVMCKQQFFFCKLKHLFILLLCFLCRYLSIKCNII